MSDPLASKAYIPIDDRARNGDVHLLKCGPVYATGFWTGGTDGMWAYPSYRGSAIEQIDFEPTHYRPRAP